MAETAESSPTLVADIGTLSTRVSLLERVEGEYRLAGAARVPSTVDPPISDPMLGLSRALNGTGADYRLVRQPGGCKKSSGYQRRSHRCN